MSLFGKKEKEEVARLEGQIISQQEEIAKLKAQILPQQVELAELDEKIEEAKKRLQKVTLDLEQAERNLADAKKQIIETDEAALMQSFGIYTPHYAYATSDEYKDRLKTVRSQQKSMIKAGNAASGNMNWTVNGSASKGKKMVSDMQKLLLRAFNAECDDAIEHVKFNNIEACEKKINASADAISKLGNMMSIAITQHYIALKMEELHLMHEYQLKKQSEKEDQKRIREEMREQAKLQKEIENARREIEKEQKHYQNALAKLSAQIGSASDVEKELLSQKKKEIEAQLSELDKAIKDVDYRAANQRAGYVYVISNIGSFGEDVYKIGMTRRLDPMDRIDELGGASVPFNFDVHAMIFTEDAPKLEAALHRAFEEKS